MTKEQYITLRSDANAANLIYLQMWGNVNEIFQKLRDVYDAKFEIIILADANGNIIKYL